MADSVNVVVYGEAKILVSGLTAVDVSLPPEPLPLFERLEIACDSTSVIIRSQPSGRGGFGGGGGRGGTLAVNRICATSTLLAANSSGRINGYGDIFGFCEP